MEPVRSRPQSIKGDKGMFQMIRWIKPQVGGWISMEVPKPPGYDLGHLMPARYKRRPRSTILQ